MKTNKDYLERIRQEEDLKNRLIDTLENKKKQINQYFIDYVHTSEE
jgi:vacuolar-type H+-ATPase subunit D/Vma8